METLKKHIEVYRINRQIGKMNAELVEADNYAYNTSSRTYRESERTVIVRESMNRLIDQKNELLTK